MSLSRGTGQPSRFRCPKARRADDHRGSAWDVVLTGRKRKKDNGNTGYRSDFWEREYRCPCGHVGWSRHVQLRDKEAHEAKRLTEPAVAE